MHCCCLQQQEALRQLWEKGMCVHTKLIAKQYAQAYPEPSFQGVYSGNSRILAQLHVINKVISLLGEQ